MDEIRWTILLLVDVAAYIVGGGRSEFLVGDTGDEVAVPVTRTTVKSVLGRAVGASLGQLPEEKIQGIDVE